MTVRLALPAAAGCVLAVGACTVGPDYEKPQTSAPAAWSEATDSTPPDAAPDLARWWETMGDRTLDSLVRRAIEANHDLRIARARVRQARAVRGVISADLWPDVNVSASYERIRDSENAFRAGFAMEQESYDLYRAGFDASWEIDLFGRTRRNVEAADADIQAAVEAHRDTLVTLLADVAENYANARGFQARLRIAHENIRTQQEAVDLTRARLSAGLGTDLDVARAEAQLAATTSQIPLLETGFRQAVHRLGVLLGREPGLLHAELADDAPIPPVPARVPVGLPSDLLRRRPDIRRAERDLAAATARIGAATADLFPRFSITGTFGLSSGQFGDWPSGDSRFWSIGPAVRWPVFDAGRIRSNIEVQNAIQEQSLAAYERTVLRAFEEVENALAAYSREQVRRGSLLAAVQSNQRAVELSNQLFSRGLTDFLSVIDAQRSLYLTQDEWVQSQTLVTTNLIALYKALGGGWETFIPDRADPADAATEPVETAPPQPAAPPPDPAEPAEGR
jgi:NodT family efflux transporter outer membrane factor (OMF) lipoprotein